MRLILAIMFFSFAQLTAQNLMSYKKEFYAMGTAYEITVVCSDESKANPVIEIGEREIERIENLISSWDPKSQTSEVVRNAGIQPVKVDKELFDLIQRSIVISKITGGAFDISFASIDKIWSFDGKNYEMPDSLIIANSVELINYEDIVLNKHDQTVFLKNKGMKIGFGGIGKGYAAMKTAELMKQQGINSGIVNAGGDLFTWGDGDKGDGWKVAIADPKAKGDMMAYVSLKDQSIVTSGDYERFAMINGVRYAHIIDPKTGWPSKGIKSVSVISDDAELADALATSIFVMGLENGLHLINQLPGIECMIIDDQDEMKTSEGLQLKWIKDGIE